MGAGAAITVRGLRKRYGERTAVDGIDLTVPAGQVFALLGPNGAGKTTTVEILEGYRSRDAGTVDVLGHDPARGETEFKSRIGIVLQTPSVQPYLTVEETIDLYRGYYPNPLPLEDLLERAGLVEQRKVPVRRLSGGQQRRLDVAIGLAGDPELLFLDEPTTGFDPGARRRAWQMILGLKELRKTVLLTTHYLDEAEVLADHVAIMSRGRIIAEGSPTELIERHARPTIAFDAVPGFEEVIAGIDGAHVSNGRVTITAAKPTRLLFELTSRALEREIELEGLSVSRPSLEQVYLELTGQDAAEAGE